MRAFSRNDADRGYIQVLHSMHFDSKIDWLQSSEDERKQLYIAARAIADASDITVEEILDTALGRKVLMGTDYISTFRRGKIRRSYAKLVYAWIAKHHSKIACEIAPDIFIAHHADAWREYIDQNALTGSLRIATFDQSLGLVQRARTKPKPEYTLKLGEKFCFHLTSDSDGYAVAFQEHEGEMHPLPLGANDELLTPIKVGEQFLPLDETQQPEALCEDKDIGHHRFVVVTSNNQTALPDQNQPPRTGDECSVHTVKVQFVG